MTLQVNLRQCDILQSIFLSFSSLVWVDSCEGAAWLLQVQHEALSPVPPLMQRLRVTGKGKDLSQRQKGKCSLNAHWGERWSAMACSALARFAYNGQHAIASWHITLYAGVRNIPLVVLLCLHIITLGSVKQKWAAMGASRSKGPRGVPAATNKKKKKKNPARDMRRWWEECMQDADQSVTSQAMC